MAEQNFDVLIRGGEVIDGSKRPRFRADVGIRAGQIAAVGDLSTANAQRVIDATGKIVAPGFIDSHTHDDQALLLQPQMEFKVSQGVTAVVTGNCGISVAPLFAEAIDRIHRGRSVSKMFADVDPVYAPPTVPEALF